MTREEEIYKVTLVGSIGNLLLVVFKFVAGILGHSSAMIADAVHSLSDFITDVIVIIFVGISAKPQDESHDYGHGKFETLASFFVALALLGAAGGIIVSGGGKLIDWMNWNVSIMGRITLYSREGSVVSIYGCERQKTGFPSDDSQCVAPQE